MNAVVEFICKDPHRLDSDLRQVAHKEGECRQGCFSRPVKDRSGLAIRSLFFPRYSGWVG